MDERNTALPRHGGDLARATATYGNPAGGWLDLSTGVNPHAYPVAGIDLAGLHRLPPADALALLVEAARAAYRIPTSVAVAAMPGSELAIRLLPLAALPGSVAVIGPTYRTHAEAWRNAGRVVTEVAALDAVPPATSVVVVANPNNPDGRTTDPATLAGQADRTGLLVVDEAYADARPELSLAPRLLGMNAVMLRSFGKFYGLPGLRLGFVAGDGPTVARLASLVGDWPVSAPALSIATAALHDLRWQEDMRARLAFEMAAMRRLLARHGLPVQGGTDLFALVDHPDARRLQQGLARRGVWTRIFEAQLTWLRIGLPGDDAALTRLDAALSAG